ncbi:hypothetical protein ZHAS_00002431 [Anopheles sinensis]|uniref:Uncharacterized protein n=1 Tax=Anopheles sinensis TaxID=74873 RepID=A0A084VC94_ANOSI|nr:hypothetical protein ZHAS_00002431 [Anopheles sinensis]
MSLPSSGTTTGHNEGSERSDTFDSSGTSEVTFELYDDVCSVMLRAMEALFSGARQVRRCFSIAAESIFAA